MDWPYFSFLILLIFYWTGKYKSYLNLRTLLKLTLFFWYNGGRWNVLHSFFLLEFFSNAFIFRINSLKNSKFVCKTLPTALLHIFFFFSTIAFLFVFHLSLATLDCLNDSFLIFLLSFTCKLMNINLATNNYPRFRWFPKNFCL